MLKGMLAGMALVVLVAIGLSLGPMPDDRVDTEATRLVEPNATSPNPPVIPPAAEPFPDDTPATADGIAPTKAEPRGAAGETDSTTAPRFDLVRATADGQLVIAGRATGGARVEILLDGQVIGVAEAGQDGAFAAVLETASSDSARRLSLRFAGTRDVAALATAEPPAPPDKATGATGATVIILPATDGEDAPILVRAGPETVDMLQPAPTPQKADLALDRITYRPGQDVTAAGRAESAQAVRIYADDELIAELPATASGSWKATIPEGVARDALLLRFDQVDASGEVTARLEAPFAYRDEGADQTLQKRRLTVEQGNNLWRIAERHYGDGIRYSVIFGANSALIRDPDLIYPGQVFAIPELVEAE